MVTDPIAEDHFGRQRRCDEDNHARRDRSRTPYPRGFEESHAQERQERAPNQRERGQPSDDVVHGVG